jgi:hypothetical protein
MIQLVSTRLMECASAYLARGILEYHVLIEIYSGAWLVMSGYMSYVFGAEIFEGLSLAASTTAKKTL